MKRFALFGFMMFPLIAAASGSYHPGGGQPNEAYNRGKAVMLGRGINAEGCKSCHKKFSRSKLSNLETSVSNLVTNCETHTPCYSGVLNKEQTDSLNAYFTKRYNLR